MTSATSEPISSFPTAVLPERETELRRIAVFLARYAAVLLGCGATCVRIGKNVSRMAARFGVEAELTVMPSNVSLCAHLSSGACGEVAVRRILPIGIDFSLNASLSRLSWEIADGQYTLDRSIAEFDAILARRHSSPFLILLLASTANAAFCRLFGGDFAAMAIVFISTLAGFRLRQIMTRYGCDQRIAVFLASFISASLSACGYIFAITSTPETALGTSVLYLVPGVPYINAVSDLIDRHYLCSFSRFLDASVITLSLSAGLCLGMSLFGIPWF